MAGYNAPGPYAQQNFGNPPPPPSVYGQQNLQPQFAQANQAPGQRQFPPTSPMQNQYSSGSNYGIGARSPESYPGNQPGYGQQNFGQPQNVSMVYNLHKLPVMDVIICRKESFH